VLTRSAPTVSSGIRRRTTSRNAPCQVRDFLDAKKKRSRSVSANFVGRSLILVTELTKYTSHVVEVETSVGLRTGSVVFGIYKIGGLQFIISHFYVQAYTTLATTLVLAMTKHASQFLLRVVVAEIRDSVAFMSVHLSVRLSVRLSARHTQQSALRGRRGI